jgi:hypothetical protein
MMMKKLLVLLTVLAMAGTASAGYTIVAPQEVMYGETFSIGIEVAGDEDALVTDVLGVGGHTSADASGVVLADDVIGAPYFEDVSGDPDFGGFLEALGFPGMSSIYYYEFVEVVVPPLTLTNGALVSNIMVTAGNADGVIDIALADAASESLRTSAAVQVVPEPMTIALLGLGGLFLRRRK